MLRILVTGGCGFVGSSFVRHLLDTHSKIEIVCLDLAAAGCRDSRLMDVARDARLSSVVGDVSDTNAVRRVVSRGITAIVNCAETCAATAEGAETCRRVHVRGTQVLLDAARDFRVPRFLQVSTSAVYDARVTGLVDEQMATHPASPYAATKAAADEIVRDYSQRFGIGGVVVRPCATYGPYQGMDRALPRFIARVLRGEPAPVPGAGEHFGDWMHVADLCAGIDHLWRQGRTGEVYHLCAGCPRSGWDLTQAVLAAAGRPASDLRFAGETAGRHVILDGAKVQRDLGWRPLIPLDRGLRHVVHWYRTHPNWCAAASVRRAS